MSTNFVFDISGLVARLISNKSIENPRLKRLKNIILQAYQEDSYTCAILFTKTRLAFVYFSSIYFLLLHTHVKDFSRLAHLKKEAY